MLCLDAPPPNEWTGQNGTISIICDELNLEIKNNYKKVRTVIRTTYRKIQKKEKYYGLTNWRGGRKSSIEEGSEEEQILATKKEAGCSFTQVMEYINEYRSDNILNYDTPKTLLVQLLLLSTIKCPKSSLRSTNAVKAIQIKNLIGQRQGTVG